MSEQSRAFVPGSASRSGNDIVSLESTDGDEFDVLDIQSRQETFKFLPNLQEPFLAPVHQVHLVDRYDQMRNPKQRSYKGMAAALFADPHARVHQDDGKVGRGGSRHHVARVLNVAGSVRDDELAPRSCEVAIGDINRNALLALGPKSIGHIRQVDLASARDVRRAFQRLKL